MMGGVWMEPIEGGGGGGGGCNTFSSKDKLFKKIIIKIELNP